MTPRKILVINLMHIGDLMLATPVFPVLRRAYPNARLYLLADKKLRALVEHNPNIDSFLFLDKKGADNHPWPFLRFLWKVRREKFDLVINLHRNERASALAAFSGGREIVGYAKPLFASFFRKVVPNRNPYKHQAEAYFDVLREGLGLWQEKAGALELYLSEEDKAGAEKLWQEIGAGGRHVIALNIGASWQTKRWCDDCFADVADHFLDEGYGVVFLGGAMDIPLVEACRQKMHMRNRGRVMVLTGKANLGELAAILHKCQLLITTDSGPMHVAVAMGTPILTMFGASPVLGFSPWDAKDVLIESPVLCHPCRIHECPRPQDSQMLCMKAITPRMVIAEAEKLLARYEGQEGAWPRAKNFQARVLQV